MESMNLKIGEKLKSIRMTRTLSLDDTAVLTGVSKPMLGQIERGQSIPTVTILWKIATGLKTPLSYFLEGPQAEYAIVSPDQANVILGDGGKMRAYPLFGLPPFLGQAQWRSGGTHFRSARNAATCPGRQNGGCK